MTSSADVREKHDEHLFATANYYEEPIVLAEGKGTRLKDLDGKSYLDFFGGILTVSVGHCNDKVNAAVKAQIDRLGHVSTLYPTLPIVELAETLTKIAPGQLKKAFFTVSGTEADETAVMLAQVHTGNSELIALRHGYSGRSLLTQNLTAHGRYRATGSQVAAVKHAMSPYCYRCPMGLRPDSCGVRCATDLEELIQTTTSGHVAGMIAEPIQGVGGFITPPKEYFPIVAEIIRKYGGIMILDEVQTGFGRTGKMWGHEHFGVVPDVMTMAKGIANGFPLSATLCTPAVAGSFKSANISTFGGNPISAAAGKATIDVILEENLVENARNMGEILHAGLVALQRRFPKTIGDVRGMGLMQAVELVVDETANDRTPNKQATLRLFEETKKRGLLIGKGGLHDNTIRLAPALNIGKADLEDGIAIFGDAFAALGVG